MDRREQLLAAGLEVFAEVGYHRTTVADIVQRAGVAQGTFYYHFETKQAFFRSLLDSFFALIEQALLEAESGQPVSRSARTTAELAAQVRDVIVRILTIYRDNRSLARLFLREAIGLEPDYADAWENFTSRLADIIAASIEDAVKRDLLLPQNSRVAAYCIVGMLERVAYHWLAEEASHDIEELATAVARFEMFGLSGSASPQMTPALSKQRTGESHDPTTS